MKRTVIYNIGTLAGILPADVRKLEGEAMGHVECIEDAYLVIEDGVIADFGPVSGDFGIGNNPSHSCGAGPSRSQDHGRSWFLKMQLCCSVYQKFSNVVQLLLLSADSSKLSGRLAKKS